MKKGTKLSLAIYGEPNHQYLAAFDQEDSRLKKLVITEVVTIVGSGLSQRNGRSIKLAAGTDGQLYEIYSDRSTLELPYNIKQLNP